MSNKLSIYINGDEILAYDIKARLPGLERNFLEKMDLDMDEGIELNGEIITTPDQNQRANYVIMNLLYAIEKEKGGLISATCNYLASRLPELKQVRAIEHGEDVTLDLIFNQPH